MLSTVTGKRQVTIPSELARELGIESGTRLEWEKGVDDRHIILVVQPSKKQLLDRAREIGRKYRSTGEDSTAILDHERSRDECDRLAALSVAEGRVSYGTRRKGRRK